METIKKALGSWIKPAKRLAILGIGSDLRGDDGAGMLVAEKLEKSLKKIKASPEVRIFLGATAPENLTGEIKRFKPTHLIVIDTVEIKERPGTIILLTPDLVGGGVSFSTHAMPARIIIDYFTNFFKCSTVIIGIQPGSIKFGKAPSAAVKEAAGEVAAAVAYSIRKTKVKS